MPSTTLRLGTRGSLLARAQSQLIAAAAERANPGVSVELVIIKTTGDRVQDRPLHELGGKGLFTKELELALLSGEVDFAVHSFKDVPTTMPLVDESELVIAAVPKREDVRDLLVTRDGLSIGDLPKGSRIGTGSLRRRCQVLDRWPSLEVVPLRGNIDTRIGKVRSGEVDAVLLAAAGVRRAGLFDSATMAILPGELMVPAPGQGALALQCRRDAAEVIERLRPLHDEPTAVCVAAEREVVAALNGDCKSPIGAWATLSGDGITLLSVLGSADGTPPVRRASGSGPVGESLRLARDIAHQLT